VDSERVIRDLAAPLPEAFAGHDYVGPSTRALPARAQTQLSAVNSAIGRWSG
jgi:hypothetical protein